MDIENLPFNKLISLKQSDVSSGFLVNLPEGIQYTNHLGTVHGSALLAVAEAGSGEFLLRQFNNAVGYIPVVRKVDAKFRKPASGQVSARCNVVDEEKDRWLTELIAHGHASAIIPVEVVDGSGNVVLSASIEWFIARARQQL